MMHIKKTALATALLVLTICSGISWAQSTNISLGVGSDQIEFDIITSHQLLDATAFLGAGFSYIKDDYTLYNVSLGLMDNVFLPELTLGLGFKALYGEAEIHNADFNVGALGFMLLGEYDFRETAANLPLSIFANLTLAPDPLSFRDTERYTEFNTGVNVFVIRNGAIVAGFRKIDIRFDDAAYGRETKSANDVFLGFRLAF